MSVWLTIPSARPDGGTVQVWKDRGYKIALWRDQDDGIRERFSADGLVIVAPYPGYAKAVNALTKAVLKLDPDCDFCVAGGDDTEPDPNHSPETIADQCREYFARNFYRSDPIHPALEGLSLQRCATFGVMQATKDRFANGSIDRIAGSPWLGREWCLRANAGAGPFHPAFLHMFSDEALKRSAEKLGVYWMRPDILHFHRHFTRRDDSLTSPAIHVKAPPHLVRWNSPEHWDQASAIFRRLESEGFASCMPTL